MSLRRRLGTLAGATACALLAGGIAAAPAQADPTVREASYYLDLLRIPEAHQRLGTGQGVVVAVVDTGIDPSHPDLSGQVIDGVDLTPAGGDGRTDTEGHGTHMAGLIAARGGGANRALGVAPGAKLMPIRVTDRSRTQGAQTIANGIRTAADRGAKVINVSLGRAGVDAALSSAVQYALSHNAVVVASAGNRADGDTTVTTPANIPGVVAVTGVDKQKQFWSGSVQGAESVVSAPSAGIVSTDIRSRSASGFSVGDGTSDGAAIVSGVAALIRARYPDLDAANVINRLVRTAADLGPAGRDAQYGFGLVDPVRALEADVPRVNGNPLVGPAASGAAPGGTARASSGTNAIPPTASEPTAKNRIWTFGALVALLILLGVGVHSIVRRVRRRARPAQPVGAGPPSYGPPPSGSPAYGPPAQPQPGDHAQWHRPGSTQEPH